MSMRSVTRGPESHRLMHVPSHGEVVCEFC